MMLHRIVEYVVNIVGFEVLHSLKHGCLSAGSLSSSGGSSPNIIWQLISSKSAILNSRIQLHKHPFTEVGFNLTMQASYH